MSTMTREELDEMLKANPHLKQVETPETGSFREGFKKKFAATKKEFKRLSQAPNDPKTPFKTKYEARKLFEDLLGELLIGRVGVVQESQAAAAAPAEGETKTADERGFLEELGGMQAEMELCLAENYYDTEEISRGYDYLFRSLEWYCPKSAQKLFDPTHTFLDAEMVRIRKHAVNVLHNLNLIGAIKSGRGEPDEALVVLRKADDLYQDIVSTGAVDTQAGASAAASKSPEKSQHRAIAEKNVFTLFFLAQVYGAKGDAKGSARYCKSTLERQYLENISFSWREWFTNAVGIVDFCMTTGGSLLEVAHAWLWVAWQIQLSGLAAEADENESDPDEERLTANKKLVAEWHRRAALVKLNAFRIKRSEKIGYDPGNHAAFRLP